MRTSLLLTGLLLATAKAQTVLPPFNADYQAVDLGMLPGVFNYGGITFLPSNPNVLLASAYGSGQIRAVPLLRNAQGFITGFGSSTLYATVGGNDGGLAFGPGGVLFFTWYGINRLGQILPGSNVADRLDDLTALGSLGSVGTCAFVPQGRSGAGRFKLATYSGSRWFDVTLTPDGNGTLAPSLGSSVLIQGGPEGILYPPTSAPQLGNHVLVAEWNAGLAAYQTDANGDPVPNTRQLLMTGLSANSGGAIDPVSGDFLFTGGGGRLVAIRTGATCGMLTTYGPATPGTLATPSLSGSGCARLGESVVLQVDGAPNAFGVLALGYYPTNLQFAGLTVLTSLNVTVTHGLDGLGHFALPLSIPAQPSLGNTHFYWQAGYLDAGTPSGFAATAGLDLWIR